MDFDAVVIGAGPAGLMAAKRIAENGLSVLICEKGNGLGQKACAEGIPDFGFDMAGIPFSPSLISNRIRNVCIFPPDERKVLASAGVFSGYIINKQLFLYTLAGKAVAAGAELKTLSEVTGIKMYDGRAEKVQYVCNGEAHEVGCRILVGADGVGSIASRSCGLQGGGYEFALCMQYVMVNCDTPNANMISFYLGKKVAPLGYAWIFPKDEYTAYVGVGMRGSSAEPYLKRFLSAHSQFFSRAKVMRAVGALVPVGGQLKRIVSGNIVLCGDAAGQVLPVIAGGIWTSMCAGKDAGEAVSEALTAGDLSLLKRYPEAFAKHWGGNIAKSRMVLKVIDKLNDDDLNRLATIINGKDAIDLANGANISRIAMKITMHPRVALKIASGLLRH
jgi:digeranylgeranylglycerophospholipid reductase